MMPGRPFTAPAEDHQIVALAVKWLPFGDPSAEDIWVQFGIPPSQFWQRVAYQLTRRKWHHLLDADTLSALQARAMTKLLPRQHD